MKVEETTFRSDGVDCAARVYRSEAPFGKATPCVVMANGFSLTQDDGLPIFAERFVDIGVTALTFDFRYLGASGGEPRQLKTPFRPVRVAHRVRCPLLVCLGDRDHMPPRGAAERTAKRAQRGELGDYPIDHFGGFLGGGFERVVADQVKFLSHNLLSA